MPDKIVNHFVLADGSTAKYDASSLAGTVPEIQEIFGVAETSFFVVSGQSHSSLADQISISIPVGTNYIISVQCDGASPYWQFHEIDENGTSTAQSFRFRGTGEHVYTANINVSKIGIYANSQSADYTATIFVQIIGKPYNTIFQNKEDISTLETFSGVYSQINWERTIITATGDANTGNGATSGILNHVSAIQLSANCRAVIGAYKGNTYLGKYNDAGGFDKASGHWGYLTGFVDISKLLYAIDGDGVRISILPTDSTQITDSTAQAYGENHIVVYLSNANETAQETTIIESVNHRGFNMIAPENTLPAYVLSRVEGFKYVETDIAFTSDNVPVCLHDDTINRTARNSDGTAISETISISDITYQQALTYDFGIWKSADYAGTKIPTLKEFLVLCKKLSLHPYLELKNDGFSTEQAGIVASTIKSCGMENDVTFISFMVNALTYMQQYFPKANFALAPRGTNGGYNETDFTTLIGNINTLKSGGNYTTAIVSYSSMTNALYEQLRNAGIGTTVWVINELSQTSSIDDSTISVLSDCLRAGTIIERSTMNA